jgi:hypothetical protein
VELGEVIWFWVWVLLGLRDLVLAKVDELTVGKHGLLLFFSEE